MMAEEAKRLQAFYSIPEVSKPFAISGLLTLLSPSTSILTNYLHDFTTQEGIDKCLEKFNFVEV